MNQRDDSACAMLGTSKTAGLVARKSWARRLKGRSSLLSLRGQYCDTKAPTKGLTNLRTDGGSLQTSVPGHVSSSSGSNGSFVTCSAHSPAVSMVLASADVATSITRYCPH